MISVPNRLQLSNGNKPGALRLSLGLAILLLVSGCNLFKPVQHDTPPVTEQEQLEEIKGRRVYDPVRGEWVVIQETPGEKIDTIRWTDVPRNRKPPITSDGIPPYFPQGTNVLEGAVDLSDPNSPKLAAYTVTFLLPFLTDRFSTEDEVPGNRVSEWAFHFYAGARIAFEEQGAEGRKFTINVLDTKGDPVLLQSMLTRRPELDNSHLIIGPYRRENVRMTAEYGKRNQKPVVSPYSASDNLTEENPFFLQLSPTLQTHCRNLLQHARREFDAENIVLICRDLPAEINCLSYLQEAHFESEGTRMTDSIEQYIVPTVSADFEEMDVEQFVIDRDEVAFIVPSWADETFVYSFLRKLDLARDPEQKIRVYGLPQWMDFQYIDYEYYEKLNVRVSSTTYLDDRAPEVKSFKKTFYDKYGMLPQKEAFVGYDTGRYFGEMLNRYGTQFQIYVDSEARDMLHTRFQFEKIVIPTTTGAENLPVQRLENRFVNILEFRDYTFQRIR